MNRNLQEEMRKLHKENMDYLYRQKKARRAFEKYKYISWISGSIMALSILALDSESWFPVAGMAVSALVLFVSLLKAGKLDL